MGTWNHFKKGFNSTSSKQPILIEQSQEFTMIDRPQYAVKNLIQPEETYAYKLGYLSNPQNWYTKIADSLKTKFARIVTLHRPYFDGSFELPIRYDVFQLDSTRDKDPDSNIYSTEYQDEQLSKVDTITSTLEQEILRETYNKEN